jgi:hypothetical protein
VTFQPVRSFQTLKTHRHLGVSRDTPKVAVTCQRVRGSQGLKGHRHPDATRAGAGAREPGHSTYGAVLPPSSIWGMPSLRWSQDRIRAASRRTTTRFLAMNSTNGFISSVYSPL